MSFCWEPQPPSTLLPVTSGFWFDEITFILTATYWSEHSFVNILGNRTLQDFMRHFRLLFSRLKANTKSTPPCFPSNASPFRSIISVFPSLWKVLLNGGTYLEAKQHLRRKTAPEKAWRRVDTVRWWFWLWRCGGEEERRSYSVAMIWDAKQYLYIPTSGSLWVRNICWDGNRSASLRSSMHRFICVLIEWRTYLHFIRLPLRHEDEALILVPTVKWSVPYRLLIFLSREPSEKKQNRFFAKRKIAVDFQKALSFKNNCNGSVAVPSKGGILGYLPVA